MTHTLNAGHSCPKCGKVIINRGSLHQHVQACGPEGEARKEAAFWAKVDKDGPDGCWLWISTAVTEWGYGVVNAGGGRFKQAHRYSYELANGQIPEGKVLMHSCDRTTCVNPAHLRVGTHADNSRDKIQKQRHRFGERSPQAKLTEAKVREIRALKGTKTQKEIAAIYGVHYCYVYMIWSRRAWAHVQ